MYFYSHSLCSNYKTSIYGRSRKYISIHENDEHWSRWKYRDAKTWHITLFCITFLCYDIFALLYFKSKTMKIIIILLNLLLATVTMAKTSFLGVMFSSLYLCFQQGKIKVKHLIIGLIILLDLVSYYNLCVPLEKTWKLLISLHFIYPAVWLHSTIMQFHALPL